MNRRARRLYLMGEKSCLKSADARDARKKLTFMAFLKRNWQLTLYNQYNFVHNLHRRKLV
jgi:hypothetical protein